MKSIVVQHHYGLENIVIEKRDIPNIHEHDVLVKIQSVSLNQLDLMIAKGAFETPLPHTLGSDAAGIVESIGSRVTTLKVGDKVATHFIQSWQTGTLTPNDLNTRLGTTTQGVFSEYIVLPETSLVKVPSNLTIEEASTLPIAALTAWEAIVNAGRLKSEQTVLLQGTGGVSIFALQFAKAIGAKVIITSGSTEKLQRAKLLGADGLINYTTTPDWGKQVLALTDGKGVDLALEMSWAEIGKTIDATIFGGKIVVVGLLGGANTNLSVFGIMQKSISVLGIQVGAMSSYKEMNKAIEVNNIKPIIDKVFGVNDLSDAFVYFEKGRHFGKVVINF